jgi:hypothetical protein
MNKCLKIYKRNKRIYHELDEWCGYIQVGNNIN